MLKHLKTKKLDMLSIFLENRNALPFYNTLFNTISDKAIYKNEDRQLNNSNLEVACVYDFPDYLQGAVKDPKWKVNTINSFKGSMILLKNYSGVEDYLKCNFSSKRRSKFRTYQKRLESVFNITYKTYYGHIELEEYKSLFKVFRSLIESRFAEKGVKNYDLTRWDVYYKIAYPLIQKKEAALFVIYHNNQPISVCLNLIRGQVIYGYIRAYDIDYSKFHLGFIDFIKQLHWCYKNNIYVFDLLKGNYPYKAQLADGSYYFQKHVIYNTGNFMSIVCGQLMSLRIKVFYKLVNVLKKYHVDKLYHAFLNYRYRDNSKPSPINHTLTIANIHNFESIGVKVRLNDEQYAFLKRPIYNLLYKHSKPIDKVEIFKSTTEIDTFYIKGIEHIQKISFQFHK
ncbi:GNAT family N-acetyltransferase [Tamlana sp. 2201CG12-4]|uniref:GNAT family N-acetyltransferase n=1 Tax=Tamlana sp. 2201CG12-4 TaxID=3112582 RepID=UPI002DB63017|nr:GNAT family N-acetyltransferase [Tamlana sp. 2201CG12-4]MEC3908030.1 GNAT family N-acetyltransferase [Tamlana sp. 2201CG12-4]